MLRFLASTSSCVLLLLTLSACGDSPTGSSGGSSAYAGSWRFTTRLTAAGNLCGHSDSDVGASVGPFTVEVNSAGAFRVSQVGLTGQIDSSGNVVVTLSAGGGSCPVGAGAGGCRNTSHCNGTAVQGGDVTLWTLARL